MRVLIACEFSGTVRDAFIARGHDAWSCDLLPTEAPGPHWCGDVLELLENTRSDPEFWPPFDLMIAHPPCTFLCSSGLHWNKRVPGRQEKTEEALAFVRALMDTPIPRICIENPVGCIGTRIKPATQYVQPYQFGHDACKRTGLWLSGLPPLKIDLHQYVKPRMVNGKPRWANQTDSGQNKLAPSEDRWKLRAETYSGIANAMADQWGGLVLGDKMKTIHIGEQSCLHFNPRS